MRVDDGVIEDWEEGGRRCGGGAVKVEGLLVSIMIWILMCTEWGE